MDGTKAALISFVGPLLNDPCKAKEQDGVEPHVCPFLLLQGYAPRYGDNIFRCKGADDE